MRRRVGSLFIAVASVCGAVAFGSQPVTASPASTTAPPTTVPVDLAQSVGSTSSTTMTASTSTTSTTTTTTTTAVPQTIAAQPGVEQGVAQIANPDPQGATSGEQQGPVAGGDIAIGVRGPDVQVVPVPPPPPPPPTVPPAEQLPPNSGNGRRIVYYKSGMRVWLVDDNNNVVKTYLVSGRLTWNQPSPGQYAVFSRSRWTCAIGNPAVCWPFMVRFTYGPGGLAIGFHEIPTNRATGRKLQSLSQLGTAQSAGCVRQSPADAAYLWEWAPVGTKVVVIQ